MKGKERPPSRKGNEKEKTMLENEVRLLTVTKTAAYLSLSTRSVYRLIEKRELAVIRIGRKTLVDRADIDNWIDGRKLAREIILDGG